MSIDEVPPSDGTDGYSISPRLSARRTSPRSPLNLSDLNSSSASESSSITEIVAAKQDLQAKLEAAYQVRKQYQDREVDLGNEISELNKKADATLQVLEDRKEKLTEENDRLQEELDSLPPVEYLEEQLKILRAVDFPEKRVIHREEVEELDVEQLVRMGVLLPGETLVVLPKRIADMILELRRFETDSLGASRYGQRGEASKLEEMELKKKIASLQKVHQFMSEQSAKEIQALTMEVERLRGIVASLEAKNASAISNSGSKFGSYRSPKTSLYPSQGDRKTPSHRQNVSFASHSRREETGSPRSRSVRMSPRTSPRSPAGSSQKRSLYL